MDNLLTVAEEQPVTVPGPDVIPADETDDVVIEDESDDDVVIEEEEDEAPVPPAAAVETEAIQSVALVEVLPADFQLPLLTRFVPDQRLKVALDQAVAYAAGLDISGPEGVQRADVAITAVRESVNAILASFKDPAEIANKLHKYVTGMRADWVEPGNATIKTVGARIWVEQKRLEAIEAEAKRKEQEQADRKAREDAQREADLAAKAQAPAPVVEELQRQARTATAAPVRTATPAFTPMRGNSTVSAWKARLIGTPGEAEPNPDMSALTPAQRVQAMELLKAIIAGTAPLTLIALDWSSLNARAKAEKGTLAIPGIEAFESGGIRAKGSRRA